MGSTFLKRILRHTLIRRSILTVLGVGLFCAIVLPVYQSYKIEGTRKGSHLEFSTQDLPDDRAELRFNLLNMDPVARKADLLVQVDFQGNLQDGEGALTRNITINLRYKQLKFLVQQTVEPFILTVPFTEGTLRDYPFEIFIAEFPIFIHANSSIPFHVVFGGISQLFKIRFIASLPSEAPPDSPLQFISPKPDAIIEVNLRRPPTTRIICIFMAALMWVLAIAMVNLALDAVIYHREIPPPLLSIGIVMLFALPTLRSSQPGVPAMGCILDMVSFFWSIVLISVSASVLIFNWVLEWKPSCFREDV